MSDEKGSKRNFKKPMRVKPGFRDQPLHGTGGYLIHDDDEYQQRVRVERERETQKEET